MRIASQRIPPIVLSAGLAILVAVIGLVQLPLGGGRGPGPGPASSSADLSLMIGVVLICSGALLFRDRWPIGGLLVAAVPAIIFIMTGHPRWVIFPALVALLYSAVANSRRGRTETLLMVIGVAVLFAASLIISDLNRIFRDRLFFGWAGDLGWIIFAIILGDAMRSRQEIAATERRRAMLAEQTRDEEARRRVSEERLTIARELHDIVAHNLALINVQAGVAAHVMDANPQQAREAFQNIKDASHGTLQELRSLLRVLRDPNGDPALAPTLGLDALDELVENVREAGVEIEVDVEGKGDHLPATVDLAAYRILQEALTNVVKHAGTARVRVEVDRDDDRLTLRVRNSATAAPVNLTGSGSGINGMRERVAALGGKLNAGPLPDGGFQVSAVLPVAAA